jgi:CubicO group peptidase (beta-lactamase class C family)
MNRREFLSYSVATAAVTVAAYSSAQHAQTLLTRIPEIMRVEGVPGLQIAVIRGGEVTDFESFGVMRNGSDRPVTSETIFEAASLTKPVFAYLVMKLAEDGMLDLDAPLEDIVEPPAAGPPERAKELTARLILSHRTGFPNWYRGKGLPTLKPSQGRLFAYSGMAYEYLKLCVEESTGPLNETMKEWLFRPLGMESATVKPKEIDPALRVTGHGRNGEIVESPPMDTSAAATLECSALDFARFACIIAKPPAASDVYLNSKSLKQMFTPYVEAGPNIHWGLGWGLQTPPQEPVSYFHWGNNNNAHHAFVVVNPSSLEGVVVMTNSANGLRACAQIVPGAVGGDHPALRWNRVIGD